MRERLCVRFRSFDAAAEGPSAERRSVGQRGDHTGGPAVSGRSREIVAHHLEITVDPAPPGPHEVNGSAHSARCLVANLLDRVRLRLEASHLVTTGEERGELLVRVGVKQTGEGGVRGGVLSLQLPHLVTQPSLCRVRCVAGGAQPAAELERGARGRHRRGCALVRRTQHPAGVVPVGLEHAVQRPVGLGEGADVEPMALQVLQGLSGVGDGVLRDRWQGVQQPAGQVRVDPVADPRVAHLVQQGEVA
ncbi:hypothetical protein ACFQV8_39350 [Pseudonocardia benzenivorans]